MKKLRVKTKTAFVLPILVPLLFLFSATVWGFTPDINTGSLKYWDGGAPGEYIYDTGKNTPEVNTGGMEYWDKSTIPAQYLYEIDSATPPAPENLSSDSAVNGVWTANADHTFTWDAVSSESGIADWYYTVDGMDPTTESSHTGDGLSRTFDCDAVANGSHTIKVRACNKAGTLGDIASYLLKVDSGTPDIILVNGWTDSGKGTGLTSDVWQNLADTPYLEWSDPAGISGDTFYYTVDGSDPDGADPNVTAANVTMGNLGEGTKTIKVRPRSGAGVWGAARSFILKYDNSNPSEVTNLQGDQDTSTWSGESSVTFTWTAANDTYSGLDGYDTEIDTSPGDWSGTTKDIEEDVTEITVEFPDGDANYFHIRALDNAGNWGDSSADLGPYFIDTVAPEIGSISGYTDSGLGTSISDASWQMDTTPYFTWSAPESDAPISGYRYALDADPAGAYSLNDTYVDYASSPIAEGQHTFKVQAIDEAGNEGSVATFNLYIGSSSEPSLNLALYLHGYLDTTTFVQQTATVRVDFRRTLAGENEYYYLVDLDETGAGQSELTGLGFDSYYLLIRQQLGGTTYSGGEIPIGANHLPVITNQAVAFSAGAVTRVNLSDGDDPDFVEAYESPEEEASSPMIAAGTSGRYWQLGGGNADGNEIINITDIGKWDTLVGNNNADDRGEANFSDEGNFNGNDKIEGYDFNVWKKMMSEGVTYAPIP